AAEFGSFGLLVRIAS
ncbi:hypothetical protein A2U01_0103102, partial [Trifolium medium]|nr:hypothetical protein [Trifolium medium]